jgi:putative ATP-binding cassette transporter
MLGIVEVILKSVPTITRASFAIDDFAAMEEGLAAAARDERPARGSPDFGKISGIDLLYSYYDHDGQRSFTMGPTTLELSKGELLFIVGGNGSGKSTLLKTFTRLYQPQSGTLLWDGVPVDSGNVRAYRSLFSSVFSDFHLFDRLYGLEGVSETRVNALLAELDIAHKTGYRDGRFTSTELSTGQRKRLGLAVALLEERPILVLDELAADQDPEFRQRFYDELVPRWKAEGRTMIVVSHDDRYFHVADRTLILRDGRAKAQTGEGVA